MWETQDLFALGTMAVGVEAPWYLHTVMVAAADQKDAMDVITWQV